MKKFLVAIFFIHCSFICSMGKTIQVVKDKLSFAEKVILSSQSPADLSQKLDKLFEDRELVKSFISREDMVTNNHRYSVALEHGMKKLAWWNYVFRIESIPGYILKLGAIHSTNSYGGKKVRQGTSKYKNISRVVYQQEIQKVIDSCSLKHVGVPKKYLYKVGKGTELHDENYIVVCEDISDKLLSIEESCKSLKNITQEILDELDIIAKKARVADLTVGNCLLGKDGKIYLIDTEHLCKNRDDFFFLTDATQMEKDTQEGLRNIRLLKKVKENPRYYEKLVEVCQVHPQGCLMGLEQDDKSTISQWAIELINEVVKLRDEG